MKQFFIILFLFISLPCCFAQDNWYENQKKLYEQAEKGDKDALSAFMSLFKHADAHYAETLTENLTDFCFKHPELVLKYWKLLMSEDNERSTTFALEYLCTEHPGAEIKKAYLKHCKKSDPRYQTILKIVEKAEADKKVKLVFTKYAVTRKMDEK